MTTRRYRSLIAVASGLAAALALCACGVPIDKTAGTLPPGDIPNELVHPPETTTTVALHNKGDPVSVYFVQSGLLSSQPIEVPESDDVGQSLLNALASGPSITYEGEGIETDLPVGAQLKYLGTNGAVAEVAVDNAFLGQADPQLELELAQTVFTLTKNLPGVTSVQFYFQGLPKAVVNDTGEQVNGYVGVGDYCTLLPPGSKVPGCGSKKRQKPTTTSQGPVGGVQPSG